MHFQINVCIILEGASEDMTISDDGRDDCRFSTEYP